MAKLDVAKALRVAMFNADEMSVKDLASKYDCTVQNANRFVKHGATNIDSIMDLADVFGMKVSEFLALGEW